MPEKTYLVHQISVFLDNRPGSLAQMARLLAKKKVNLRALSLAETRDFGTVRLIVSNPDESGRILREAGYHVAETDVLAVEVADRPGGMADVLEILAREHLNVEYIYAMVEKKEGFAVVILRVNEPLKTVMALRTAGIRLLSTKDLAAL